MSAQTEPLPSEGVATASATALPGKYRAPVSNWCPRCARLFRTLPPPTCPFCALVGLTTELVPQPRQPAAVHP
jgi:hypothetical protein